MARPERNNVDYFPMLCKEGKVLFYIEHKYKNDGYATWIKILRQLAVTNYHYLNLNDESELMLLSSKCNVSETLLIDIINDLVKLGEFDKVLWKESRVVWCQKFIDSISDAYLKRNNKCITLEGLFHLLHSLGVRKLTSNPQKVADNPQSIVDNIKVKEKELYLSINPFLEKYGKEMCRKFYDYWSEKNKSGTKLKFEMEKTWDIEKRLKRWSENSFQKNGFTKKENVSKIIAPKNFPQ